MNWIFYTCEFYLIICQMFLCGKDATSYRLFDLSPSLLQKTRTARWHRDGAFMAILYFIPCLIFSLIYGPAWYWITIAAVLIRLAMYDVFFNDYAGLPVTNFGTTAGSDRFFSRIFGVNGAVTKAIVFLVLLLALNILKIFL